jgi:hypothetical protein
LHANEDPGEGKAEEQPEETFPCRKKVYWGGIRHPTVKLREIDDFTQKELEHNIAFILHNRISYFSHSLQLHVVVRRFGTVTARKRALSIAHKHVQGMQLCEGNRETGVTLWLQARE